VVDLLFGGDLEEVCFLCFFFLTKGVSCLDGKGERSCVWWVAWVESGMETRWICGAVLRCCGAAGRVVGECVRMDLTWGFGVGKVRCCKLV
jgi:hypothetical protein